MVIRINFSSTLLCLGLCVVFTAHARADYTGIHSETNDNIARRQATQAWMDQMSRSSSNNAAPNQEQGPSYIQQIEAQIAAREARLAADKARQEQWEKERIEAENRHYLQAEFAKEAADAAAFQKYWDDRAREDAERVLKQANDIAAKQGRKLTLNAEQASRYFKQRQGWENRAKDDPQCALLYGYACLNGSYGTAYNRFEAQRTFTKAGFAYLNGIATYFLWFDEMSMPNTPATEREGYIKHNRGQTFEAWKTGYTKEKNPAAQQRMALGILALELDDQRSRPVSSAAQQVVARMIHRALAAQHGAIAAHPAKIKDAMTGNSIWLDAGVARVLWDAFASKPELAPCAEIKADLHRLLDEAEDPISHLPATFYSEGISDWAPRGSMPATAPTAQSWATLTLASHALSEEKPTRIIDLLSSRAQSPVTLQDSRDPILGELFHQIIEDRLSSESVLRDLARRCWALVAASFSPIDPAAPNHAETVEEAEDSRDQLKKIAVLAPITYRNAVFFAAFEELTHVRSSPEIVRRASELTSHLKENQRDRDGRRELALLAINHPDILDDAQVAEAAFLAVKQPSDEMKLISELDTSGPIGDRYRAVMEMTNEQRRHPFFWAALAKEQCSNTERACRILEQGVVPATPESIDLMASYLAGDFSFDAVFQYKTQLAALALSQGKRRYSRPRETLERIYQEMTKPYFDAASETDAVRQAREALEGNPSTAQRQKSLVSLVDLQREFDAANLPNETALQALENATDQDNDGSARTAFVSALRSSPAWSALSEERRLKSAKTDPGATPEARFGTWQRRSKGWHLLIPALIRGETWAAGAVKSLSLQEVRDQLRDLLGSDFGDSFHEGNLIVQAYLATQQSTNPTDWQTRLAKLQPMTNARDVTDALIRGATEPWTNAIGNNASAAEADSAEAEACVNCLVAATATIYHTTLNSGFDEEKPPAAEWGQKEIYEALATLGPHFKKPRKWNESELGHFSPECLTALFADRWEFISKQPERKAMDLVVARVPLEEIILGCDSLIRERHTEEDETLLGIGDYNFGKNLLAKALVKVPGGDILAKQLADEEISVTEVIERLRKQKLIP